MKFLYQLRTNSGSIIAQYESFLEKGTYVLVGSTLEESPVAFQVAQVEYMFPKADNTVYREIIKDLSEDLDAYSEQ